MADIMAKTIKFPGLNNTYEFMQPDGTYPDLTAGNIISNDAYNEDTEPYLFRALPYKSKRLEEDIVGATVNWNQLVQNGNFVDVNNWFPVYGTISVSNNELKYKATSIGGTYYENQVYQLGINVPSGHVIFYSADMYALYNNDLMFSIRNGQAGIGSAKRITGVANQWNTVASVKKISQPMTDIAFYWYMNTNYQVGDEVKLRNVVLVDLTQMLGSTIADYVATLESSTAGAGVAWLKSYGFFTKPYYDYDAGTLKPVNPTAHKMVGKNLCPTTKVMGQYEGQGVWNGNLTTIATTDYIPCLPNVDYYAQTGEHNSANLAFINYNYFDADKNWLGNRSTNGDSSLYQLKGKAIKITDAKVAFIRLTLTDATNDTTNITNKLFEDAELQLAFGTARTPYVPYEEHTYDLGNVPLYGLFQLENGKLKAYGDVRHAEGGTDRNFSVVDLGDLPWTKDSDGYFYSTISDRSNNDAMCEKYMFFGAMGWDNLKAQIPDKQFGFTTASAQKYILVHDSAYTTSTAFKTAVTGIKLQYEKETTTTEDTPSFEKIQSCFPYGTEEYITTNGVPVGHNTKYFKDVISSIAGIPEPPSGSGTYELQLIVTDGVAAYSWVAV